MFTLTVPTSDKDNGHTIAEELRRIASLIERDTRKPPPHYYSTGTAWSLATKDRRR